MIEKAGLAVVRNRRILLVKKKGLDELILPGGKPESGESKIEALNRELEEELGVSLKSVEYLGSFTDKAAGRDDTVTIFLFKGEIIGKPIPRSEIESVAWISKNSRKPISPVVKNRIMPYLVKNGSL